LKLKVDGIKRTLINIGVDIASILLITAACSTGAMGFYTLYSSYYKTLSLPTPESFSAASLQFASTISFMFAVLFTRKYRIKDEPDPLPKNKEAE
jgi:hypothetical protein